MFEEKGEPKRGIQPCLPAERLTTRPSGRVEDEINVPIALGAFRDKPDGRAAHTANTIKGRVDRLFVMALVMPRHA